MANTGYVSGNSDLTQVISVDAPHANITGYSVSGTNLGNYLRNWTASDGNYFKSGTTGFQYNGTDIGNIVTAKWSEWSGNTGDTGLIVNYQINSVANNGTSTPASLTIPDGIKYIRGFAIGAGGGGGGTRNGTIQRGGGGGGGAGAVYFDFPYVPGTNTISITYGNGGVGGKTSNANSWGENGGTGGSSSVNYSNYNATAVGGGGGVGGSGAFTGGSAGNATGTANLTNVYAGNAANSTEGAQYSRNSAGFVILTKDSPNTGSLPSLTYTGYGNGGQGGAPQSNGSADNPGIGGTKGYVRVYFIK